MKDTCMKILNDINMLLVINENMKNEREMKLLFFF